MPPRRPRRPAVQIPEEYLKPGTTLSLAQLVDVGLRSNPATREAWSFARAAAADVGSKRARCTFPSSRSTGTIERQKQPLGRRAGSSTFLQTTYGPSVAASWLLFDFGGRQADVEEATRRALRRRLDAQRRDPGRRPGDRAGVLRVSELQGARRGAQGEPRRGAAQPRRRRGAPPRRRVATIADVLQAQDVGLPGRARRCRTRRVRSRSSAERSRRPSAFRPTCRSTSGSCPSELPLDMVKKNVDELIAQRRRRAAGPGRQPVLGAGGPEQDPLGRRPKAFPRSDRGRHREPDLLLRAGVRIPSRPTTRALLTLRIPVFTGFDVAYRTQKAQGGGRGRPGHRRGGRGPGHPRRLVELLRGADGDAARRDDARPARERDAVGRGRRRALQGRASARSSTF